MLDAREVLVKSANGNSIPIRITSEATWPEFSADLPPPAKTWAAAQEFTGASGSCLQVPSNQGAVAEVFLGSKPGADGFALARHCRQLPPGLYSIQGGAPEHLELAWCLEAYVFDSYKSSERKFPRLVSSAGIGYEKIISFANAAYLVRDLINTPANDLGPDELEAAARKLAKSHNAKLSVISGAELKRDFPMIHAVGKASPRHPRLIDMTWGKSQAPKVTLVGKGVCFDTGGLDIKTASGMALMKKDMGGAANVLGLAQMIMEAKLPVHLRVLIPAVENAISGEAFRPGDILKSRKGLTIEIGNTDAEGRLVLGDALALADEEEPDLLVDMATLTGAARVALGPDLPPFYTSDEALASELARQAIAQNDPLWRLPLWERYNSLFESSVADMSNSGDSGFAGSITAALFLKRFVERTKSYIHLDVYGWTPTAKPGSPKGGEAQGIRALFALIGERYQKQA